MTKEIKKGESWRRGFEAGVMETLNRKIPPNAHLNGKEIDTNESVVVMSAVRYMLGRSSYGVGSVCDFLKDNKGRLSKSNKEVIVRDIDEYIVEHPDLSYKNDWLEIISLLK